MWSSVKAVYCTKPKGMVYSFKRHFGTKLNISQSNLSAKISISGKVQSWTDNY